jgi:hypothetical protein
MNAKQNRPSVSAIQYAYWALLDDRHHTAHPRKGTITIELAPGDWNLITTIIHQAGHDAEDKEIKKPKT